MGSAGCPKVKEKVMGLQDIVVDSLSDILS